MSTTFYQKINIKRNGYTVWVTKAQGEKCVRCWKYRNLNEDGICEDCANAIK